MNSSTTLFQTIGDQEEVSITFQHRRFNGIDSDPKVIVRAPDVTETAMALELVRKAFLSGMALQTALPYPEGHRKPQDPLSPRFAGVAEGSETLVTDTKPNPCICRNASLIIEENPKGSFFVKCNGCGRLGFRAGNQNAEEAIHRWNTGDFYPH